MRFCGLLALDCSLCSSQSLRSAHGTSRKISRPISWQNSTDVGSPPCSPQIPQQLAVDRFAQVDSHLHQLANASLIQLRANGSLEDLSVIVCAQELCQRRHGRNHKSSESDRLYRKQKKSALRSRQQSEQLGSRSWYQLHKTGQNQLQRPQRQQFQQRPS